MANGHSTGDSVRVDDNIGCNTFTCKWQVLQKIKKIVNSYCIRNGDNNNCLNKRRNNGHKLLSDQCFLICGMFILYEV